MKLHTICSTLAAGCLLAFCSAANADIIRYYVEFDQSGDVALGSTLDWNLFAEVTGEAIAPDDDNFGIETAAIDLQNNTGETMMQGAIAAPFNDYGFTFGGTAGTPGRLTDITATLTSGYDAAKIEAANPGNGVTLPGILLATGSYQVNTLGTHTLSTTLFPSAAFSEYFIDNTPGLPSAPTNNFVVQFGSDSVNVVAGTGVPEPGSMLLLSTFVIPAVVAGRRRRKRRQDSLAQAT